MLTGARSDNKTVAVGPSLDGAHAASIDTASVASLLTDRRTDDRSPVGVSHGVRLSERRRRPRRRTETVAAASPLERFILRRAGPGPRSTLSTQSVWGRPSVLERARRSKVGATWRYRTTGPPTPVEMRCGRI